MTAFNLEADLDFTSRQVAINPRHLLARLPSCFGSNAVAFLTTVTLGPLRLVFSCHFGDMRQHVTHRQGC
jgi:hypothetical protein